MAQTSLELWRRQRERRRARLLAAEVRRTPRTSRPGGNIYAGQLPHDPQDRYRPEHSRYAGMDPHALVVPLPIAKHVTQNAHRLGSIAYSFLYGYWLPNAAQSK